MSRESEINREEKDLKNVNVGKRVVFFGLRSSAKSCFFVVAMSVLWVMFCHVIHMKSYRKLEVFKFNFLQFLSR